TARHRRLLRGGGAVRLAVERRRRPPQGPHRRRALRPLRLRPPRHAGRRRPPPRPLPRVRHAGGAIGAVRWRPMRRLLRSLFTLTAVVSLVLCIMIAVLWVRSFF